MIRGGSAQDSFDYGCRYYVFIEEKMLSIINCRMEKIEIKINNPNTCLDRNGQR